ncbi:MAG: hypothetical protein LBS54_05225 [Dysgonamonadaceae bacterium]|jgi:hypothetical protein|nr:hypothetical protein [Dysgonamonadaceae bacterium]
MKYLTFISRAFLLIILTTCFGQALTAQVTVGSTNPPAQGALLQIKDTEPTPGTDGVTTTMGGLVLPRVELKSLTTFFPSNYTPEISDDEKIDHKGLLVYNLEVDEDKKLEKGIYQWNGTNWQMLKKITETEGATTNKLIFTFGGIDDRYQQPHKTNLNNKILQLGIFQFRFDWDYVGYYYKYMPFPQVKLVNNNITGI